MDAVAARTPEIAGLGEGDHVLGRAGEFQNTLFKKPSLVQTQLTACLRIKTLG
jgi:hypothetical protein